MADNRGNLPEFTVSEISLAVKRTLEGAFERVRVRGEISGFKRAGSGHLYFALKDEEAKLDAVCWRTTAARLAVAPEDGLEVVATGRVSSYPGRSSYQLLVESIELAGEGALLKLLEERRKKLAAEGLFDGGRKRPLPFLPEVIGVITSPSGAVIRDILHRLADRFPRRVLLWPVLVQGEGAKEQIAAAIAGFNALQRGGRLPRPDLLIVARGGGSLEDLWAFNEEIVVRAAAASAIPLISAVGHETDTTLIDFVSDRRAPTPTAAAEMATPVLAELAAALADHGRRLIKGAGHTVDIRRTRLTAAAAGLPRPMDLMAIASQSLDLVASRLGAALRRGTDAHGHALDIAAQALRPRLLLAAIEVKMKHTEQVGMRLQPSARRRIESLAERLSGTGKVLISLEPRAPLKRGFALVWGADGRLARRAADLEAGEAVKLEFADGPLGARVDGEEPFTLTPPP